MKKNEKTCRHYGCGGIGGGTCGLWLGANSRNPGADGGRQDNGGAQGGGTGQKKRRRKRYRPLRGRQGHRWQNFRNIIRWRR